MDTHYGTIESSSNDANTKAQQEDSTQNRIRSSSSSSSRRHSMTHVAIAAILSTAFSYSCIITTFFLLIGPIECQRIENESREYYSYTISKSIALGGYAGLAGLAQLITPLIGLLSDSYVPNKMYVGLYHLGKRMPYLILGTFLTIFGMVGMIWASSPIHPFRVLSNVDMITVDDVDIDIDIDTTINRMDKNVFLWNELANGDGHQNIVFTGAWLQYSIFFLITMFGINIVYTVMIPLIPDLGMANGTLALLIVCGSLFGFLSFHVILDNNTMGMYSMYIIVSLLTAVSTCFFVYDREHELNHKDEYHGDYTTSDRVIVEDDDKILVDLDEKLLDEKEEMKQETEFQPIIEKHQQQQNDNGEKVIPALHTILLLLYEPIMNKSKSELLSAYWIDTSHHYDFFIVTISRFFYYMGISSQTFFLYFIHDVLKQSAQTENPELAVALLAIIGQSSGAITCYPVGILSDQYWNGRRKPFVYAACILLAIGNLALVMCTTLNQMIGVCILLGASNGMYLTMDTSLAVDTLEKDEEVVVMEESTSNTDKGNDEKSTIVQQQQQQKDDGAAQLLGVWGVFGFIGSALGPLIGGTALLVIGNIPASLSTSTSDDTVTVVDANNSSGSNGSPFYRIQGYEVLFSLSAFYFFCSALSLGFVKKKGV